MKKKSKKGGFAGYCVRRNLKLKTGALLLLMAVAALCMICGEASGVISGALLAVAPLAFTLPEGVELTDSEKKGLGALASHFTEQFGQFAKGKIGKDEALEAMGEKLKAWGEENGVSQGKIASMEKALKEQGEVLSALKEQVKARSAAVGGLKAAFMAKSDELVKALKEGRKDFVVKAISEHNDDYIQTTENSITTTSGAVLSDSVQVSDRVFFKRRGRQYIDEIANVNRVDEVPEVFIFQEEGDEQGAIGIVEENAVKPQVHLSMVRNQVEKKKAAGYIVVTEEMLKWRSRLWAQILRLFQDKVGRDYEDKLTLDLLVNAAAYVSTPLDGTIENPTDFDAIIAGILQLENLNFRPDVLVINPADKWKLAMTQTNNGMFILPYIQQGGQFGLLGLNVVTTTKIDAGSFLLGESGTWFVEREAEQLRTGMVNDDLIHNRMTIVGEIFFLSYVPSNNAGSFVSAKFADVKEALKKTA